MVGKLSKINVDDYVAVTNAIIKIISVTLSSMALLYVCVIIYGVIVYSLYFSSRSFFGRLLKLKLKYLLSEEIADLKGMDVKHYLKKAVPSDVFYIIYFIMVFAEPASIISLIM